ALSRAIEGSSIVRGLDTVLPEPPSVLAQVRTFVDRFGFPQVFTGLPPDPGGPVSAPTDDEAARAYAAAADSTVEVLGEACGQIQEGSGFVVEDSLIVTNAHVVAGVAAPSIRTGAGGTSAATVLVFDPHLDVAVLRVEAPPGPRLPFAEQGVTRGDAGVVAGYPGGGTLTGAKAAVLRTFPAVGRDIYGKGEIERDVIELQAAVRPGNSGGPFVLANGEVGGLVFAASVSDPKIGYAIAIDDVEPSIQRARAADAAVATGRCVP
ncbi:MAG: MarP family serine protease, partial [Actinomycetota bacterium]